MTEMWNHYDRTAARTHGAPGRTLRPASPTIDIHAHAVSPEAAAFVRPHLPAARNTADPASRELGAKQSSDRASRLANPAERLAELDAMGIDIKKYPCCYAIHRPLDGILALRKAHALTPANVTKIAITNSAGGLDALLPQPPVNGLHANFNMAYCLSAALRDGAIRLASFDDAQVMRPEIRALLPKVSLQEAPGAILPRWSHVRLELADGQVLEQRVNSARGDAGDPLSDAELIKKVADCFACGWLDADAGVFARRVFELSKWRVDDVILALHASR